jgi:hypothetical protein
MWLDREGNLHTIANPILGYALEPQAAYRIRRMSRRRLQQLGAALDQFRDELDCDLEDLEFSLEEDEFVNQPLPPAHRMAFDVGIDDKKVIAEMLQVLQNLPLRWRLDAVDSVQDLLDDLLE